MSQSLTQPCHGFVLNTDILISNYRHLVIYSFCQTHVLLNLGTCSSYIQCMSVIMAEFSMIANFIKFLDYVFFTIVPKCIKKCSKSHLSHSFLWKLLNGSILQKAGCLTLYYIYYIHIVVILEHIMCKNRCQTEAAAALLSYYMLQLLCTHNSGAKHLI